MSEWTTNAECGDWLQGLVEINDSFEPDDEGAILHAAAILSAPGVVDLDPEHTAEILTWALRIAAAEVRFKDARWTSGPDVDERHLRAANDAYEACPPHVREALKRVQ